MPAIAHQLCRHSGWRILFFCFSALLAESSSAQAESVAEIPVLAATSLNDQGVFEVLLLRWDRLPSPSPIVLQWQGGNIRPGQGNLSSMARAFQYAVDHTSHVEHVGTVSAMGIAYAATGTDGPSAGAVMTVGFAALFNGDRIRRGIALTGTIRSDGTIGPVGGIPDKVRAAVREGYRTILIPEGQRNDPQWNIDRLAWDLNVEVKEVSRIDEAYHLMTGGTLE
jgi:PDZ domain-containing protein